MAVDILTDLSSAPVVPLVQSDDPNEAIEISQALLDGGIKVLEVVLRTEKGMDCLEAVAQKFPDSWVGAGTVLSKEQGLEVIRRGANFIVSPGLDKDLVAYAQSQSKLILPGIATASELQSAWNMGLRTVKFFPSSLAGGVKMIAALSSVFRDVRFMPTGGVNVDNLAEHLAVPSVIACGGSWLTPSSAIKAGDFAAITKLAEEAITIATKTKANL